MTPAGEESDDGPLIQPVVSVGGGGLGINLHVAPADLVAALGATVVPLGT